MHRIDTATKAVDLFGSGKHGFQDGTAPGTGSTRLNASWFNAAQEELCNVVEGTGIPLASGDRNQLVEALECREIVQALGSGRIVTPGSGTADLAVAAMRLATGFGPLVTAAGVDGSNIYIVSSSDGGYKWVAPGSGLPAGSGVTSIAIDTNGNCLVGAASGKWTLAVVGSSSAASSGDLASTPDINQVIWDDVNDLWWAATNGGLYYSAAPGGGWTLADSNTNFKSVAVLPSGRVIAYRSTNDKLYYTDTPFSTVTAGVTLSSSGTLYGGLQPLTTALGVVAVDSAQKYFRSVNGSALALAGVSSFFGMGSFLGIAKIRERIIAIGSGQAFVQAVHTDTVGANLFKAYRAGDTTIGRFSGSDAGLIQASATPDEKVWISGLLLRQ